MASILSRPQCVKNTRCASMPQLQRCFGQTTIEVNILRPRQSGRRFADDTFKCIFLNENVRISFKISLKFVPLGPINNIPALVQLMVWRRPGDKPLSEPMIVSLPTHICVTRPQWVEVWTRKKIPHNTIDAITNSCPWNHDTGCEV